MQWTRNSAIYGRTLREARPCWPHLIGILGLSALGAPLALFTPLPLKLVVDSVLGSLPLPPMIARFVPGGAAASSTQILTLAVGLLIGVTLLIYLEALAGWMLQTYTGEKLILDLRAKLFGHLQRMSLTYHDTKGSSDSVYRIQWDASCMQSILITSAIPLITAVFTLVGMVAITAVIDWQLAVIALLVCPVLYAVTHIVGNRMRTRWTTIKELDSASMGIVQEALSALRVVKAFGGEDHERDRFVEQSQVRVRNQVDLASMQGRFDLYVGLTMAIGTALVLYFGVVHVQRGVLTLGELLIVMAYLSQIYEPLKTIGKKLTDLESGVASAERAFALLDHSPEVVERPHARRIARARGNVVFRDVCFSYEPDRQILRDICLEAPAGACVGIQGRTGSGKSTLTSLLMRFYDPTSGQILLDGIDLRDYALADLRNQFALVLQDAVLFSTTLAENIAYGRPEATPAEIENAARLANADEFIRGMPDGYATRVGERGMKLSGGERQRISIARAFLKDAPMLILDEPTSSVDIKTEAAIMDAMERLMLRRTSFLIAHRLSTLERCDMRLEIERGRIARSWSREATAGETLERPAAT